LRKYAASTIGATVGTSDVPSVPRAESRDEASVEWSRKLRSPPTSSPSGSDGAAGKRRNAAIPTAPIAAVAITCAITIPITPPRTPCLQPIARPISLSPIETARK